LGFKYQDHVAAYFVLKMIGDRRIAQVECETSDDITVMHRTSGGVQPEYIQVKTTDKDAKWTIKEITTRTNPATPSSIVERSLLSDRHQSGATFRIISYRDVNKALFQLTEPLSTRDASGGISEVAAALMKRLPKAISDNGNDLAYWARNTVWQPLPAAEHLQQVNLQKISRLAEEGGESPTYSHSQAIYRDLLNLVETAASASRRKPLQKIITREAATHWWIQQLAPVASARKKTTKPYRIRGTRFFTEIHTVTEDSIRRNATGYDTQYEQKVWRSKQLARYMADWLPEVTLRASELVEINQLNLRQKVESALKTVKAQHNLNLYQLMGETLLHSILRHHFGSEPIACKLFHRSHMGDRIVGNAHVIHHPDGDELWLGRARFFLGNDRDALIRDTCSELKSALSSDLLSEERQIILQLREPHHLLTNDLDDAFSNSSPVTIMFTRPM
jgi:hypothetical protein